MTQPFSTTAADRNKKPIFEHLKPLLSRDATVLEVGAGTGTHACYAVACMPEINWQPSEHPARVNELERGIAGCNSLPRPLALDVTGKWPDGPFAAVYAANVTHIMAWSEVECLFAGSAGVLKPGGLLCLYGPFHDDDITTAPSNLAFDEKLRHRSSAMGLRRIQAIDVLAQHRGLRRCHDGLMPANNRLLVWQL